jgi:cytochrome d ubiquinol oxidase subunit II
MTSPLEAMCAALILAALSAYVVLAGADFGGGVWDALASSPLAQQQRKAIAEAMGPVWETNHIWLIFTIVGTWTAFPTAFATMFTLLAVPVIAALAGIVLRGGAFALRERAGRFGILEQSLGALFGATSIVTPFFLGAAVGTLATDHAGLRSAPTGQWLQPFPVAVGIFALCMCALLAATFLTVETKGTLQASFRGRALAAWFATALVGLIAFLVAYAGAPVIFISLAGGRAVLPFAGALAAGLATFACLLLRRFALARVFVVVQVTLVLWTWAWAQYPYIIVPSLTIAQAAAPARTLLGFAIVALAGLIILAPSLWYLFHTFKGNARSEPAG